MRQQFGKQNILHGAERRRFDDQLKPDTLLRFLRGVQGFEAAGAQRTWWNLDHEMCGLPSALWLGGLTMPANTKPTLTSLSTLYVRCRSAARLRAYPTDSTCRGAGKVYALKMWQTILNEADERLIQLNSI